MKYSKQRNVILQNVLQRCDHPSVEDIYVSVKQEIPNISLGTVYRNLNMLVNMKQIRKIHISTGCDRFDKTLEIHAHFCCIKCNQIYDIMDSSLEGIYHIIEKNTAHHIILHDTVLIGICSSCNRKEEL